MTPYAIEQLSNLLSRVAVEMRRASRTPTEEAVHDLRVSIRRLGQGFRSFVELLPRREIKRMRRRLRDVMDHAGEVRNRDIALELCEKAGLTMESELCRALVRERHDEQRLLVAAVHAWLREGCFVKWRLILERSGQA